MSWYLGIPLGLSGIVVPSGILGLVPCGIHSLSEIQGPSISSSLNITLYG